MGLWKDYCYISTCIINFGLKTISKFLMKMVENRCLCYQIYHFNSNI